MSDVAQGALIAGAFALLTLVVTLAFNYRSLGRQLDARLKEQEAEQEERYRISLYDKRLAAHQQAFEWTQKLGRTVFLANSSLTSGHPMKQLDEQLRTFVGWYDANNLYLDPVSMHELVGVLRLCGEWARGDGTKEAVSQQVETAQGAIVKGIGLKHIDFTHISADLRSIREQLDAK